jgi:hypothetical protein
MPTKITIAVACLTIMIAIPACDRDEEINLARYESYYWHEGEKIALEKTGNKLCLLYYSADEDKLKEELAKAGVELGRATGEFKDYSDRLNTDMSGSGAMKITNFKRMVISGNDLNAEKIATALHYMIYRGPSYKTKDGSSFWISEIVIVVLKPGTSLTQLEKLAKENAVEMIGRYIHNPERYYLVCTRSSKGNALQMANLFYESGLFETTSFDQEVNIILH